MPFHRLSVPTYFGGLPGGYDYINNATSGTPAFADGPKTGGPNAGTYFVSFGEDATSNFANRGLKALAENTDIIDNVLRRDIALTARTANVTAASPVSSVTIAGQVFVGAFGVANNQDMRDRLISVLDGNDNEIIDSNGVVVRASLIHNGTSTNVVGTQSSGFFNTPVINFNVPIPTGTVYRLYYGERSNLYNLPLDAFTNIKIRGAQEVSGDVERLLRDLHSYHPGTLWTDAWTATINGLARRGFDGVYRHSTSDPGTSGPPLDTPGSGAGILRDGPALTFSLPNYNLGTSPTISAVDGARFPDPHLATIRLQVISTPAGISWDTAVGGNVGIIQESPYHTYPDSSEVAPRTVSGPLLLDMVPRDIRANSLQGHPVLTRITATASGLVNPDGGSTVDARRTIQVATNDFLRDGSSRTGIRQTDLIELSDPGTGAVIGTYRPDAILSATRMTLKALTGGTPRVGATGTSTAVRIRWLQPTVSVGGTYRAATADQYGAPQLLVAAHGYLSSDWDTNRIEVPAVFLAATRLRTLSDPVADHHTALAWGGFDTTGAWAIGGRLEGDGSINCAGGRQTTRVGNRARGASYNTPTNGGAVSHDPYAGTLVIYSNALSTAAHTATYSLNTATGYSPVAGDEIEVWVDVVPGTGGTPLGGPNGGVFAISWPADFFFSGADGVVPTANMDAVGGVHIVIRYIFTYQTSIGSDGWYARRWDY